MTSRASATSGDTPAEVSAPSLQAAAPSAGTNSIEDGHDIGLNCAAAQEMFPQYRKHPK